MAWGTHHRVGCWAASILAASKTTRDEEQAGALALEVHLSLPPLPSIPLALCECSRICGGWEGLELIALTGLTALRPAEVRSPTMGWKGGESLPGCP